MIRADGVLLRASLALPGAPRGLVIFAHGSGSSRESPRNLRVAAALEARGLATLLFDLLTPEEDRTDARFDIALLARRLGEVSAWARRDARTASLPIGYFGASTGAAAALVAAAEHPERVVAVVSRGGRPDLATTSLPHVVAPTLLVVGGADTHVLALHHDAVRHMRAPCSIEVVPGATHLFEEPGALDEVAGLAADFFVSHFDA